MDDINDLIKKLLSVEGSTDELGGDIGTNSYRNPNGPEAADALTRLSEAFLWAENYDPLLVDQILARADVRLTPKGEKEAPAHRARSE